MSRVDTRHWKISTGRHFQNVHHNTTKIQHCPIPSKFDMLVDNDDPTLKNFYRSPFSKWLPQYRTNSTLFNFNEISCVCKLSYPELIPDIKKFLPVSIFKMAVKIWGKNGDVWETFRNSILLLSYLVFNALNMLVMLFSLH